MSPRLPSVVEPTEEEAAGRDRWLLSYADFMTLLLALFVVLYASARIDVRSEASLFEGLQAAFMFEEISPSPVPIAPTEDTEQPSTEEKIVPVPYLSQLEGEVAQILESQPARPGEDPGVQLHQSERGLVISLASAEFFPAGGVEIAEERRAVLGEMAPFLAATTASIHFEGHTDDQPIQSGPFPSNWELSTARAAAVARLFIEDHGIDPTRIAITGYAEFRPAAANEDGARRARNRRVEIVVLKDGVLVEAEGEGEATDELDELLEVLPPIPAAADESLRPEDLGPPPEDIPLP